MGIEHSISQHMHLIHKEKEPKQAEWELYELLISGKVAQGNSMSSSMSLCCGPAAWIVTCLMRPEIQCLIWILLAQILNIA